MDGGSESLSVSSDFPNEGGAGPGYSRLRVAGTTLAFMVGTRTVASTISPEILQRLRQVAYDGGPRHLNGQVTWGKWHLTHHESYLVVTHDDLPLHSLVLQAATGRRLATALAQLTDDPEGR